jgi:diguanylate cyclase (GGDEF)-like protein/PAS domain S-box-containing protein
MYFFKGVDNIVNSNLDIHKYLQSEILKTQNEILELLANQHPFENILNILILKVEKLLPFESMGCILLRQNHLTLGKPIGPSLPKQYLKELENVNISCHDGSCGKAAYTKEIIIVKDVSTDPLWDKYRHYVEQYGLKSCWAVPIIEGNEAIGTFGFYYKKMREPNNSEIEIVKSFTKLLAIIIQMKNNELMVLDKEKQYRMIANNVSDLLSTLDSNGSIKYISPSHQRILGYPLNDLLGKNTLSFIHPDDINRVKKTIQNLVNKKQRQQIKYRFLHADGHYITLDSTGMIVHGDESNDTCVIVSRDITEQETLLKKIENNRLKYHSLFIHNLDAIISLDLQGKINEANPAATVITNYSTNELKAMHFLELLPLEEHEKGLNMFQKVLSGTYQEDEFIIKNRNGINVVAYVTAMPINVNDTISGVYIIAKDITKQKEADSQILFMAYHDQLTNLPNRHKFNTDLQKLVTNSKENNLNFSVLYIDLDGFKEVNDLIGHRNGDSLLKEIASRLLRSAQFNSRIYRIGGDEFMVIIPNSNIELAKTAANQIINTISVPIKLLDQDFIVTPSIGISQFPLHGQDIDTLIQKADAAMYESKKRGKSSYSVYKENPLKKKWSKVKLRTDLIKAIEENELVLHYQPKIDIRNREIGIEALIRWNHPEFGMISPLDFIPIAEEYGLIGRITYWVIEEGLKQIKTLSNSPLHVSHLSVNVSAYQLESDKQIVSKIEQIINEQGIDPSFLELEMTETTLMRNSKENIKILNRFKKAGVKIAIDDFGLNFSSLNYIKHFPIDRIKIDRSFIQDITTNYKDAGIVDLIISLSHKLDMKVTAEGVEELDQLSWLINRGCNEIQGFYYSKPHSIKELSSQINKIADKLNNYTKV